MNFVLKNEIIEAFLNFMSSFLKMFKEPNLYLKVLRCKKFIMYIFLINLKFILRTFKLKVATFFAMAEAKEELEVIGFVLDVALLYNMVFLYIRVVV